MNINLFENGCIPKKKKQSLFIHLFNELDKICKIFVEKFHNDKIKTVVFFLKS